jgi:hypothetical protein
VARFDTVSHDTTLREYLIGEQAAFMAVVGVRLPAGFGGGALAAGKAWRFSRYELPEGHSAQARHPSELYDELELGADDVLRLVVVS